MDRQADLLGYPPVDTHSRVHLSLVQKRRLQLEEAFEKAEAQPASPTSSVFVTNLAMSTPATGFDATAGGFTL